MRKYFEEPEMQLLNRETWQRLFGTGQSPEKSFAWPVSAGTPASMNQRGTCYCLSPFGKNRCPGPSGWRAELAIYRLVAPARFCLSQCPAELSCDPPTSACPPARRVCRPYPAGLPDRFLAAFADLCYGMSKRAEPCFRSGQNAVAIVTVPR